MTAKLKKVPAEFTATMRQADVDLAYEMMRDAEPHGVCATCPVAQVLNRMYPGYNWQVGYGSASYLLPNAQKEIEYILERKTSNWIHNLPSSLRWNEAKPLGKFKVVRKQTETND